MKPHHRIYLAAFLLDCALMAAFTVVPFYIYQHLGGGARMSGVIGGLQSLCYAILSLVSARYVSGARNGMIFAYIGTITYGTFTTAAVFTTNPFLFAASIIAGFTGLALVWPAQWSWLGAERDPAIRVRRISHYNVAWSVGLMIGPLVAGPLYKIDYRLPFLLVFLLSAVTLWLQLHTPQEAAAQTDMPQKTPENAAGRSSVLEFLYVSWFANFMGWIVLGASRSVFPKRVAELAQFAWFTADDPAVALARGALVFSWLSFIINGARLVMFGLMGVTSRWQGRIMFMLASQALAAVACWVLSWTQSIPLIAVCCAAVGVCGGVCFFYSAFYTLADAGKKHMRAAINEAVVGAGGFTGSVGFGLLAAQYDVTMPFRWTPLIILAGFAIHYALLVYGRRKASRSV